MLDDLIQVFFDYKNVILIATLPYIYERDSIFIVFLSFYLPYIYSFLSVFTMQNVTIRIYSCIFRLHSLQYGFD